MTRRFILSINQWCLLCVLVVLYGCAGQIQVEEHGQKWISRPLSELQEAMNRPDSYASQIGWKETTYPLTNGDSVFVEPLADDCFIHWEVTPGGIILAYRPVGSGCERKSGASKTGVGAITSSPK
ncbi:MAG: hypothetical protein ACLPX5_10475 [Dissulfurispiraceae bacterium]